METKAVEKEKEKGIFWDVPTVKAPANFYQLVKIMAQDMLDRLEDP